MIKRIVGWLLVVVCMVSLAGCGAARKRHPLIDPNAPNLSVMGMRNVRDWGDALSPMLQKSLITGARQYAAWRKANHLGPEKDLYLLALSGGGADGAFGAGVLCGWTDKGDRPEFRVVTGVSTGALSAPFAFLGEKYDPVLRKLYTNVQTKDIFFLKSIWDIIRGDSVADTGPLKKLVETYVTPEMMAELAREHARGRRLFIATTNLDAQRNVVWDIGAIASSGNPNALELIHKVMIASASIPVAFPPVYIPVEKNGETFDEMHVDGGVISQFIVYDAYLLPKEIAEDAHAMAAYNALRKHVCIIVNNKLGPVSESVRPRLAPIALRSISTLIKSQAKGSLAYSYLLTKRDGMSLDYIVIPEDFDSPNKEPFDPAAMRKTFDMGYALGKEGQGWQSLPPGYVE
ncbi:Patatin [Solidesulfovibrio fructosivorans JJ]]|uniref:Patatin n=1 Tax=Solidesulfovibrio fructosivorans JJ] TaxID=596151 RepID=E1JYV3_SOLFR|nr:patatin-like phospholipase family protein [Solidesulfovibrio fructosivorans]EFL50523.1 Patatin [Solidesulfovibrio fructosivorans JJ]]